MFSRLLEWLIAKRFDAVTRDQYDLTQYNPCYDVEHGIFYYFILGGNWYMHRKCVTQY
jgi:hypothetical protein